MVEEASGKTSLDDSHQRPDTRSEAADPDVFSYEPLPDRNLVRLLELEKCRGLLPFWVADFSFEGQRVWPMNGHDEGHRDASAAGKDLLALQMDTFRGILTLQGLILDGIGPLSPDDAHRRVNDSYSPVVTWRKKLEMLLSVEQDCQVEETQDQICKTVLCGQNLPNSEMFRGLIWAAIGTEFEEVEDQGHKSSYTDVVLVCRYCRRCITSTRGFLGQVPSHTQVGDVIVIPLGSAVPFVVRLFQERYKLVGQAYIYGFKMGEALQFEDLKVEDIELC